MAVIHGRQLDLRAASLFDVDPELGELMDRRQLAEARPRAVVAVHDLPAGPWSPEPLWTLSSRPFGLMVVEGMLIRELLLAGSTATELLGPTDIVDDAPPDDALLPAEAQWSVPHAARIVILDDRLLPILRAWPAVGRTLLDRATRRESRLSTHRAIAQLPRVDQRLLAFFGHLAERWGRVAAAGVVVPLQLTHETLGRLIGARRPTVSLALKDLAGNSLLERRNDGSWLLRYAAFERLGADGAAQQAWRPADARQVEQAAHAATGDSATRRVASAGLGVEEIAALHKRIAHLREQHLLEMSRCATVLERSRATRRRLRGERAERTAA
jgi:CRP/FNR family cyclic AMP-dependent transcriptional regulator